MTSQNRFLIYWDPLTGGRRYYQYMSDSGLHPMFLPNKRGAAIFSSRAHALAEMRSWPGPGNTYRVVRL